MIASLTLALFLASALPPDTSFTLSQDSIGAPVVAAAASGVLLERIAEPDTVAVRRRPRAVEVSDSYETRLRIHRYGSYLMYPLFAIQTVAGNQLIQDPTRRDTWRSTHSVTAGALAGVFGINTVTGLWNLYDSRNQPQGRARRYLHTALMLAADAGFTYSGIKLADEAKQSQSKRIEHRNWAYGSMAASLAGVGVMYFWKE